MKEPNPLSARHSTIYARAGHLRRSRKARGKKVIALQLRAQMQAANLSETEMAKRLKTSRSQLDRELDPNNATVSPDTLERAALAIGKRIRLSLEEIAA